MEQENLAPLIEFIGKKFDQADQRFEAIDRRFEEVATKGEVRAQQAETRRHFDVVAEGLRGQMQLLAEGVATLDQKLNRFREEVAGEFQEMKSMIRFSYAELDRRIQELESNYATLNERVVRLEARIA
jgi:predicted RNase H-like nuclease (RuvC/YqgF family)